MYTTFREYNTDIHVYVQESDEHIRLLQFPGLRVLSRLRDESGNKPVVAMNCSYFNAQDEYVLGRNQGDMRNDTHDQAGFYDLVFLKDGTYQLGQFKSWDYQNAEDVLAGFSVATVLIKEGADTQLLSTAIVDASKVTAVNPQSAIAVLEDGKVVFIVSEGRNADDTGLTGNQLRTFVKTNYPTVQLLCQLDGGGSSEMIVNGEIKNVLSDGSERSMLNGLAIVKNATSEDIPDPVDPSASGTVSIYKGAKPIANYYVHPDDANTRHVTDAQITAWDSKASGAAVTSTTNGLMIAADKVKLDGIAENANNYVHPDDANTRHVTDAQINAWNAKASTAIASQTSNGLMSSGDKKKLDGLKISNIESLSYTMPASQFAANGKVTIPVTGVTTNSTVTIGLAETATTAQYDAAAYAKFRSKLVDGGIEVSYTGTLPVIDIPASISVVRTVA